MSRVCTVNCQPTACDSKLSHLRSGRDSNSDLRGGRRMCYQCAIVALITLSVVSLFNLAWGS